MKIFLLALLLGLPSVLMASESLKDVELLAISVADDTAVVKLPDMKEMQVLQTGDTLLDEFVIEKLLPDRLVLHENVDEEQSLSNVHWVYKAKQGNASRIESFWAENTESGDETIFVVPSADGGTNLNKH